MAGGPALDAVCAAVAVLEDDPHFNAGVGSCLTSRGTVEMDASVMEGTSLRAGAACVLRAVRNPVRLARAILDDGRHVMLAGTGADQFAVSQGLATCDPSDLVTAEQLQRWRLDAGESTGTVGAAAVDRDGHVAAATSTGGISGKLPGRVGDSAIIGAGTYADDSLGAASATGHGELIIRMGLSRWVVEDLEHNNPAEAANAGLSELARRVGGGAGIIVADKNGRVGYAYTTEHMVFGYMQAHLSEFVVHP